MPTPSQQPQPKKSGLAAKYGAKLDAAIKAHAQDDTDYGFIPVPSGITNGVAQLQKCYFEVYKTGENKDQYYFRATGVVVEPTHIPQDGRQLKVKGLFTSIQEPICDTKNAQGVPTTQEQHITRVLNEMRKLAGDDSFTHNAGIDDLEGLAAALEEMGPYFYFSTAPRFAQKDSADGKVKKGDQTGVWENWHGNAGVDYVPPEGEGHSDDQSGEVASPPPPAVAPKPTAKPAATKPATPAPATKPASTPPAKPPASKKAAAPAHEPDPEPVEEVANEDGSLPFDLEELKEDAMSNSGTSEASGEQIIALATEAGMSDVDARNAKTWEPVIEFIQTNHPSYAAQEGDGTQEDEQPEGWKAGDECMYSPIDPRTKKPVTKPVKCKVHSVNEESATAVLKAGKATYNDVELDKLEVPS